MSGIHVLSEIPKGGNKLERTSTPKGKDVSDSPENVAAVFAAMFSGLMNSNVDPKGQNSKAGEESEEKQSPGNNVLSVQDPNGQASVIGYGNFVLANLFQPMLQSDLPAGKEANSGNHVTQGNGNLATANEGLLNLISLVSDEVSAQSGMTTPKQQGNNPIIPELDKYRQVIANLLVALSGEITDTSSARARDPRQEMTKIVQGWLSVTDEATKDAPFFSGQKGIERLIEGLTNGRGFANPELNEKFSALLAALNPLQSQEIKEAKTSQGVNGTLGHIQQKLEVMGSQESKTPKLFQGIFTEEAQKVGTQATEVSVAKDITNISATGIGVASNLVAVNVADGKTIAIPVWQQISTVLLEQVMNKHQALKELEIQLHPADLGKIQIGMRWENGQVHLVVQASEAATGQLLQNQLSDLRQNLTNQGVNCGMLQMGQGGERQQNRRGNESHKTFNQNADPNEDEALISVTSPLSLGQDGINRLNVTA